LLKEGLNQANGKANGPTHKKATTINDVLKYHLTAGYFNPRVSPQYLHLIASSWISSAQNGHFFIISSLMF